jgi:hypothetical protein
MAFNLKVFQGVSIQQVRDAMNYRQYLKPDEEVEGLRLSKEEQEKHSSPVLLSVVTHTDDDERKSEPIQ